MAWIGIGAQVHGFLSAGLLCIESVRNKKLWEEQIA
jgi:hypothetical protein